MEKINRKERELKERRIYSVGIILHLIIAIFAFSFMLSLIYVEEVSGLTRSDGLEYDITQISGTVTNYIKDGKIVGSAAYGQFIYESDGVDGSNAFGWIGDSSFSYRLPTTTPAPASLPKSATLAASTATAESSGSFTFTEKMMKNYDANRNPDSDEFGGIEFEKGDIFTFEQTYKNNNLETKIVGTDGNSISLSPQEAKKLQSFGAQINLDPMKLAQEQTLLKSDVPLGGWDTARDVGNGLTVVSTKTVDGITTVGFNNGQKLSGKSDDITGAAAKAAGVGFEGTISKAPIFEGFGATEQFWGHLLEGAGWALVVGGAIKFLAPMLGIGEAQTNALSLAAMGGIFAGKSIMWAGFEAGYFGGTPGAATFGLNTASIASVGVGLVVALIILQLMWKDEQVSAVEFSCLPYEAPTGGKKCEECNKDPLRPCSEYRCRSLGQACEIVNAGTEKESCVWVNPRDVESPIITTDASVLTDGYAYNPNIVIRPAKRGVEIYRKGAERCVKAFTPLQFGFMTNEPAQCKIDYSHTGNFSEMSFDFGETALYLYNHTQRLSLPGPKHLEQEGISPEIKNDGEYSLFVRCMDKNGNVNEDEFSFKFCVEKGPDTTPPEMVTTSFGKEAPFTFNVTSIPVNLYVNEPAECRWSHEDKAYDSMEYNMTCANNIENMNPDLVYICIDDLEGLKNRVDNKFYFRCKDQPLAPENERNKNSQSFVLNLKGTQPLEIVSVSPSNESVKGYGEVIQVDVSVETRGGYNDNAFCYLSSTQAESDYVLFADTNLRISKQRLDLPSGSYTYYIKCVDLGGNSVYRTTRFSVESDNMPPRIVRAFKTSEQLKITTDEDSTCSYSTTTCSFDLKDGIAMPSDGSKEHAIVWDVSKRYYIKCKDKYENEPAPSECNSIIRGFNAG